MNKALSHTLQTCILALLCAVPLHAQKVKTVTTAPIAAPAPQQSAAQPCTMPGKSYYLKHIGATIGINAALMLVVTAVNFAMTGDTKAPLPDPLMAAYLASSCYIGYKTPQWIDTYLLKNGKTYTTKQNIIRFIPCLQFSNYLVQKQQYAECCATAGVGSQCQQTLTKNK